MFLEGTPWNRGRWYDPLATNLPAPSNTGSAAQPTGADVPVEGTSSLRCVQVRSRGQVTCWLCAKIQRWGMSVVTEGHLRNE